MGSLPESDEVSHRKLPRQYAVVMDCRAVRQDLARRIMMDVFFWSERYVDVLLARLAGEEEDATHPYSSKEIAESKVLQAIGILTDAGEDPIGISMRPV